MRIHVLMILALIYGFASQWTQGAQAADAPQVSNAPPNTWVKLSEEPSGFRLRPLFYYDPELKRFVASGGEGSRDAHADTEHFDLSALAWTNAYPSGAPYKVERGPSDAKGVDWRRENVPVVADKGGVMRIVRGINPYEWDPGLYGQWVFAREEGRCYANLLGATLMFDPKSSAWSNLKVPAFAKQHTSFASYGTWAWDPVNKEVLSVGGTSDDEGGTAGVHAFNTSGKEWKKTSGGSKELKDLNREAEQVYSVVAAWVNGCRNRRYLTESRIEAQRDLAAEAQKALSACDALASKLKAAHLSGVEAKAPEFAFSLLSPQIAKLKALSPKAATGLGEALPEAQQAVDALEGVARALDPEPCGRAAAAAVTCYGKDKIVLFGGCRFDGYLADTWVYDCKTRQWEQRHPSGNPAPRAGHVMVWLPKSQKVLLYGAITFMSPYGIPHGNEAPPQDLWIFDVDANQWKRLAEPARQGPVDAFGAVDDQDCLIAVGRDPKGGRGRVTWAMKVQSDAAVVADGQPLSKQVFETPADYDKANGTSSEDLSKTLSTTAINVWTPMPKSPKRPNSHPWGKTPYDPIRHQWISFGGGHSNAHFNDVAHYSMRTATWSCGYGEEYPYANASFSAFYNQSFRNRPTIPTHLWDCVAFDEITGKVVFCIRGGTWLYDPATRAWEYPPLWEYGGGSKVNMTQTPSGVIYWDQNGRLSIFDAAKRVWSKLPMKGQLGGAYCDTGGIIYDSKRDCLWMGHGAGLTKYDMKTGEVTADPPSAKPECAYMRGAVYLPELDMILTAGRQKNAEGAIGNLAYDLEKKKWVGLELPCSDQQPRVNDQAYSDINLAVAYDPEFKVVILHTNQQEILVGCIDKASIKMFEPKFQVPVKK